MSLDDGASAVGLGDAGKRVMEQYGLEKKISKAEKAQSAAKKAGEAQIMSQYGSVLSKPYEEFKPSQESASGFAALGSLLMVAGGMMGGSGRMAGIGAMNNIAGMMKGYQQGRKDLYDQERTQFEENMKVFEKNRTLIKEAFDRALKLAPYNLTTAQNNLRKELQSLGATIPAEMTAKSGLVQAAGQHDTFHTNTTNTLQSLKDKLGQLKAENLARKADLESGKGTQEWVNIDGKIDRMTRQEVDAARSKGQKVDYIPTPVASQAVDPVTKIGQGIGDVLQGQTEEGRAAALKSIKQYGVVAGDEKLIPVEAAAIRQAERTATNIANNPEAIGVLATVSGKVGEPTKSIMQSISGIFDSGKTEEQKAADAKAVLDSKANQIDKALDDYAAANPTAKDQVRQAKIIGKELFSLALADAVAVGRPTVFLERALSNFYSPNVRPEVLIEIIKTRALDGNERLPKVFRQDTWQVPSKLLQTDSAEAFMKAVTGQQAQPSVTPAPNAPAAPSGKKQQLSQDGLKKARDAIATVRSSEKTEEEKSALIQQIYKRIDDNGFDIGGI